MLTRKTGTGPSAAVLLLVLLIGVALWPAGCAGKEVGSKTTSTTEQRPVRGGGNTEEAPVSSETNTSTEERFSAGTTRYEKTMRIAETTEATQTKEKTRERAPEMTGGKVAEKEQSEKETTEPQTRLISSDTLVSGAVDFSGGPLMRHRMVSFYGHPYSGYMGVLGRYADPQEMVADLKDQAAAYTEADPDRPAICTIELIATVAQADPGADGLYLFRTPPEVIEEYSRLAEDNGCLLLLDIQPGYSTIAAEVEILRPFLERPHVHLAIDPEWDMAPGEVPGEQYGQSSGREIMDAAQTLQEIVETKGLEAKVLVVHQFRYDLIWNKEIIRPLNDVEVVLHADGFGTPQQKIEKYNALVPEQPIQYGGFKLFYYQDTSLLSPEQVLEELEPDPAVVSYQ